MAMNHRVSETRHVKGGVRRPTPAVVAAIQHETVFSTGTPDHWVSHRGGASEVT